MISPGSSRPGFRDDLAHHSDLMSPGAGGVLAVLFLASAKPRFQRQARERKLKAAGGSASVYVIMWADECLVIRSESDLREAMRRIGLTPASDTAGKPPWSSDAWRQRLARPQRSKGIGAADRERRSRASSSWRLGWSPDEAAGRLPLRRDPSPPLPCGVRLPLQPLRHARHRRQGAHCRRWSTICAALELISYQWAIIRS